MSHGRRRANGTVSVTAAPIYPAYESPAATWAGEPPLPRRGAPPRRTRAHDERPARRSRVGRARVGRYMFARVARSEIVTRLRLNYTITPALTLEGYLEPFASSGR